MFREYVFLLTNLGSKHSLVMKFCQFMQYYKTKRFTKKLYEKWTLETSSRPFLIFKESSMKMNLRRSTCCLDKFWLFFYYIFNISSSLQKFNFPTEVVLNSLQTQKGLELVLRLQFSQKLSVIFTPI